jgi:nitrate reductase NapAB chaperone NapD
MIKIYHEAPKSIFKEVQQVTDGDYALVHLMEEDPEYLALFKQAKEDGREIILDNSIFELEEAFDAEKFAGWVLELKPDWYIVPDALEDAKKTCSQMAEWNIKYRNLPGKKIGVVQGKTYEQIKSCYEYMDKMANVDMIAISFDYSYYTKSFPHPNKLVSWAMGRAKLLGDLLRDGIINENKKHHLLGCSVAWEFTLYQEYPWIYSIDTSNPTVHAIKNIPYGETGLWSKESQKLFELINYPKDKIDLNMVLGNIHKFRWLVNGKKV